MRKIKTLLPAALVAVLMTSPAFGGDKEELLKLKQTTVNLIEALVKEGILSRERADEILSQAEKAATVEAEKQEREQAAEKREVVRVPYVPDFVRDEIRDEVRAELREDVVQDVLRQAETERWGVPQALPEWISRIKFKGDIRLREQYDRYASDNFDFSHVDFNETNEDGTGRFLNTTQDRLRTRVRLRLGMDAKISSNLKVGVRLATGNTDNPVSTNETLGGGFNNNDINLDRAYLKYDGYDLDGNKWLTLAGGRMPNPWFSTDLVWDRDLNFDGVAATFIRPIGSSSSLYDIDETPHKLFFTVGAFPLQEEELTSRDKWLFGGQLGSEWQFADQSTLKIGVAYYDFFRYDGRRNALDSRNRDYTAPESMQKGNSVFEISNDTPASLRRFGLAADFKLLNLTARYDIARFSPAHIILTGDYVRNIGYDNGKIRDRTGGSMFVNSTLFSEDPSKKEVQGFLAKIAFGWPTTALRGNWQASVSYKYLERDAVVDAFTDSDFHLGGTNAKGWILGGKYGLMDNTWLQARWLSADEIKGPPLGVDVFQLDLNSSF